MSLRILVLTKRQYTGMDLLDQHYGRLFHLPECLQALGHEVRGVCLSYRPRPAGWFGGDEPGARVPWLSTNLTAFPPYGLARHWGALRRVVAEFRPDVLWASADVLQLWLAARLSRATGVPFVADLYDNYESFGLSRLPGATALLRRVCRQAHGLTVVSQSLDGYVAQDYDLPGQPRLILGNGFDETRFHPMPKDEARQALGLPQEARLVGTAGALDGGRGIGTLLQGFALLARQRPGVKLVLAGPRDDSLARFAHPDLIDLGRLAPEAVPLLFNALDVAVICNRDSAFGRYCYPQKFPEIAACGTPLVAAAVGEMAYLLQDSPQLLFHADDPTELAARLMAQLDAPSPVAASLALTWPALGAKLGGHLEAIVAGRRAGSA